MIKAVIDANVFISSALAPGSIPDKVIDLVRQGKITLVISPDILAEIREVLLYPKIKKRLSLTAKDADEFVSQIAKTALITAGLFNLKVIKADPQDDKYLACALEGQADYIISGDRHLLDLKSFRGIKIMPPGTFLESCQ
jgi:putative PIN family toxin of toxin-antitoxin system